MEGCRSCEQLTTVEFNYSIHRVIRLLMPRTTSARRAAPTLSQPEAPRPIDEPPAAALAAPAIGQQVQVVVALVFRVGEYEVGEGFCPRLCGHPGIRY